MPEPERNIEKVLREYAARRRQEGGEPPPLNSHVRRSLRVEVSNRYAPKQSGSSFLALFRPAWGWQLGAVAAALVVVALVLFNRQPQSRQSEFFAKNEARAPAEPTSHPVSAPARPQVGLADTPAPTAETKLASAPVTPAPLTPGPPATAFQPATGSYAAVRDEATSKGTRNEEAPIPGTVAGPAKDKEVASAESLVKSDSLQNARYGVAGRSSEPESSLAAGSTTVLSMAESAPTNVPPVVAGIDYALRPDAAQSLTLSARPVTETQLFRQLSAAMPRAKVAKSSPAVPVLTSFRVEQTGNALRIVDHDGSIYTGYVQPALTQNQSQPVAAQSANFRRAANVSDSQVAENQLLQNLAFRVLGTNRSLKQKVVFTGNILGLNNSTQFAANSNVVPPASNQAPSTQAKTPGAQQLPRLSNNQLLQNSTITGQAVVGGNNILRVQAVPAQGP